MMELPAILSSLESSGMPYLVIGGLAVRHYGVKRETSDLDLLIERSRRGDWENFLAGLGYALQEEYRNFLRFSGPGLPACDLMLVDAASLQQMHESSQTLSGYDARVPRLEHLIALKVETLRGLALREQKFPGRQDPQAEKTLNDIAALMQVKQDRKSA